MKIKPPLNKRELEELISKITEFARECGRNDSLGRLYAWVGLRNTLRNTLQEESIHNFEYPSPGNPNRDKIVKNLNGLDDKKDETDKTTED